MLQADAIEQSVRRRRRQSKANKKSYRATLDKVTVAVPIDQARGKIIIPVTNPSALYSPQ